MKRVLIVGTGLIGASVGLALKTNGFEGSVVGWDQDAVELEIALRRGAIDETLSSRDEVLETDAEVIVLADTEARWGIGRRKAGDGCGEYEARNCADGFERVQSAGAGAIFGGASDGGKRAWWSGFGGGGIISRSYLAVLSGCE
jgi:threonine dehydrogenase-like Zn-dependent dehydrogenase